MTKRFDLGTDFVRPDFDGGMIVLETATRENCFCSRPSEPIMAVIYLMIGVGAVLAVIAAVVLL